VLEFLRVGLVGAGIFGRYHAGKIAAASEKAVISGILDADTSRAQQLATDYASVMVDNLDALLDASDAVVLATPAGSHADLVAKALNADCHVLVEKPLALSSENAAALVALAGERGLVLQVGHQERLVCNAIGLFDIEEHPRAIRAVRACPPPTNGRGMDVSVVWDLMIHDLDIVHCLAGPVPDSCTSFGVSTLGPHLDKVETTLLVNGCRCDVLADRTAASRNRVLEIEYASGTVRVDFLTRTIVNSSDHALNQNFADDMPDPLGASDIAFIAACRSEGASPVPGREAAWAVATAERIEQIAQVETEALHG